MGIQAVHIDVDVHEPNAVHEELGLLGAEVKRVPLPIGDYRSGGAIVERKTVRDLHLTLATGRLWGQIGRLRAAGRSPYLLVEGKSLDDGPLSPAAARGALLAVGENGVTVVRTEGRADSALWLYRIGCRATRQRPRDRPLYAQKPKERSGEAVLAAIPDISTVSARALLARFGSVAAIVEATDAEITAVTGIGPVRARSVREALSHPQSAYRSRRSRERQGRAT